jgi:hypothetical protein
MNQDSQDFATKVENWLVHGWVFKQYLPNSLIQTDGQKAQACISNSRFLSAWAVTSPHAQQFASWLTLKLPWPPVPDQ